MGMDLYTGPLTRYCLGAWLTGAQAPQGPGVPFDQLEAPPGFNWPEEIRDMQDTIASWQRELGAAVGAELDWPEAIELPYWCYRPNWQGCQGIRKLIESVDSDRTYLEVTLPSWWLPMPAGSMDVFATPVSDTPVAIAATVDLLDALRDLNDRTFRLQVSDTSITAADDAPMSAEAADADAVWGLASYLLAAEIAVAQRQPLVLDF